MFLILDKQQYAFIANAPRGWTVTFKANYQPVTSVEVEANNTTAITVEIKAPEKTEAGKYSQGMLQRLGLADVLIKNPEVIILDEPTLGIDPTGVKEFLELIVKLSRAESLTVLFSSHDLHHVQQVCDRVGLFVSGRLLAEGDIPSLSRKLFHKSPFRIEVGVSREGLNLADNNKLHEQLKQRLLKIEGVIEIGEKNDHLIIDCSHYATSEIARVIVESDHKRHDACSCSK